MLRLKILSFCALAIAACVCLSAQAPLNNESVVKLVKAGLGEDVIIGMVELQPSQYSLAPDDLIGLKKAGVSDKVIAAMLKRNSSAGAPASGGAATPAPATSGAPSMDVGVYVKKGGVWTDMPPEVVNWKTGGVLKTIGTAGIVKGDVNGHLNGPHSNNQLKSPVEIMVVVAEGVGITEYQLLRLRDQKDSREFRTVTGGVLHVSGGATRDLVPFESTKSAPRTYTIVLPNLGAGEYGFLPPGAVTSSHASASLGKMYTFRLLE